MTAQRIFSSWVKCGLIAIALFFATALPVNAILYDCTYSGGTGNWSDTGFWSPCNSVFPNNGGGDTFNATVNSGTVTLDQNITIQAFTLGGGTLTGTYDLTLNDTFTFNGGQIRGSVTVTANGGLSIGGTGGKYIGNAGTDVVTLINPNGEVANWTAGAIVINGSGSSLNNDAGATFNVTGNTRSLTGIGTFVNDGEFNVDMSSDQTLTFAMSGEFANHNQITVNTGTLRLTGNSTHSGDGDIDATGAELQFNGGTHTFGSGSDVLVDEGLFMGSTNTFEVGSTFNATNSTTVSSGTTTFNSGTLLATSLGTDLTISSGNLYLNSGVTYPLTTYTQTGGTWWGTDDITVSGLTTFDGGVMRDQKTLTANGGLSIGGNGAKYIGNAGTDVVTLINPNGEVANWTAGAIVINGSGSSLNNDAGATFNVTGNTRSLTGIGTFVNDGEFNVDMSSDQTLTFAMSGEFANHNQITVNTGTLRLTGNSTHSGDGDIDATGAELQFNGGTHTFGSGSDVLVDEGLFMGSTNTFEVGSTFNATNSTTVSSGTTTFNSGTLLATSLGTDLTISSGNLYLNSGVTYPLTTYTQTGGTWWGTDDITVSGLTTFDGGVMRDQKTLTANGGLSIGGNGAKYIGNAGTDVVTLINPNGEVANWTAGAIVINGSGSSLNNDAGATFNVTGNTRSLTGIGTFVNDGEFNVDMSSDQTLTFAMSGEFANHNQITVNTGTLRLTGNSTHSGDGDIDATGAELQFNGGTHTFGSGSDVLVDEGLFMGSTNTFEVGSTFNATNSTTVSSGTTTFNSGTLLATSLGTDLTISSGNLYLNSGVTYPLTTYTQTGGTWWGTDDITVSGLTTFDGGVMRDQKTLTANGGLSIGGNGAKYIGNAGTDVVTLINPNGEVANWTAGAIVINGSGSSLNNDAGATFNVTGNTRSLTGIGTFVNDGEFNVDMSSDQTLTFAMSGEFANHNQITVNTGTLRLTGNSTHSGDGDIDATGAELQFNGGTHTFGSGSDVLVDEGLFMGSTNTFEVGSTFNATNSTTVSSGTTTFNSGTLLATSLGTDLTISGGNLYLNSGVTHTLDTYTQVSSNWYGTDDITVSGLTTFDGGVMQDQKTLTANGGLSIGGNGNKYVGNAGGEVTLINTSGQTANWTGGNININGSGSSLINETGATFYLSGVNLNLTGVGTFVNEGLFNVDLSSNTDTLGIGSYFENSGLFDVQTGEVRLNATVTNTGTVQTSGGVINLNAGTFNNELTGILRAGNGDITVFGGQTPNSGTFEALAGNAIIFAQVGPVTTNNVSGTLTDGFWRSIGNNAVISINGNPITNNAADITLSGAGSVFQTRDLGTVNFFALEETLVQTDATGALRILDNRDYTTTNAYTNEGITQLGGGTFDAASVTNNTGGEIFGFGSLADQVANSGTVRATGGTLIALQGILGPSGTVQIDADGIMDFSSAPAGSTAGILAHNGSASGSLNLGANNITVYSDYNNANFGEGNSFNHRANVIGSGQILAAGDVAQAITGSNITGGTTANPTATFGNVHVGDTAPDLTYRVANTGTTGPALRGAIQTTANGGNITDSRLSGTGVTAANFGPIATGADSGDLTITFTPSFAGALTGQVIHIENNFDNVVDQDITIVDSAVYRYADVNTLTAVDFGSVHVGDTVEQALTVTNTAPADGYSESLNAVFGSVSDGRILTSGSITQLIAGDTDNTSMVVGLNTSAVGTVSGTATVNFESDGEGTSGLGITGLGSQAVNVDGIIMEATVYRLANPVINTAQPVAFGNVRVGDVVAAQALSITNDVPDDGLSESLNASADGTTGGVIAAGSFSLLAAQATNTTSITVNIDTTTAGDKSGVATIDFESDGTGTSGLGITALPSQGVNVTGGVFRLAEAGAHSPEPVVLGDSHVGDTAQQALSMTNTAAADGYSESLNAVIGSATGDATASGSFNLLAAGATDTSSLVVGINTGTAGAKSGTASIGLESDGTGTSGIVGNVALTGQTVNISGNVYRLAVASAHTPEPVVLGNVHVGDTAQQALTLSNTAAGDGYSEALNAVFGTTTGDATAAGSINQLGAGGTDTSSLLVGIDTSTAGAKSGTAALDLESDGTGINTLGQTALAGQTVNISGNVYRLAEATIDNPLDFSFGSVHVGDTVEQGVSITNTAVADSYSEGLNASFGGTSDVRITTNGGSFNLLAAGGTDNTSMVVGVDTSAAGTLDGTATLNFASDGTGTSGLGITALPPQDLTVTASISATAYNYADPVINTSQPVAFGNVRVGDVVAAQALSITNDAPDDGFSESLNASADGTTGGVIAAGSFSLLAAQATNTTSITVNIDTTTAGDKSGVATIDFESDGTGTSGLGITALPSQGVNVTGGVFRLAEAGAHSPEPVVLGDSHVGDTAQQALSMTNTAAADGYSESLNAVIGSATGDATASGSFNLLAAGATDTSSLVVGINTGTAGAKSGTASIGLESDGTGTSGIVGNVALTGQTVNISGNVYRLAVASAHTPEPVVLGNVHVGDTAQQALTLSNTAAGDGYSEALNAVFGTTTGDATAAGSINQLGAGGTDTSSLLVGIDTSTAGAKSGTAALDLESDGTGINTLGQTALAGQTVNISGNVYRLAEATIDNPLDFSFGSVHVGDTVEQGVSITNTAVADSYSEGLNASFGGTSDVRITTNGGSFNLLAAGGTDNTSMVVGVDTSAAGTLDGTATLNFASDGTGTSGLGITALPPQDLTVTASISATAYNYADPVINTSQPVAFGNVRVGDVVAAQALSITNDAPDDGFSESLNASADGTTGGVIAAGSFSLLAAQATNTTSITVNIDTTTAGDKSGVATIDFESDGTGTSGLGITALPSQGVNVTGGVFRLAEAGAHSPEPVVLGDSHVGDTAQQALSMTNTAAADGYSESLNAVIGSATGDATASGSFNLLAAGATDTSSLVVGINTGTAGAKSGTASIGLESDGTGTSGIVGNVALTGQTVNISGNVYRLAVASAHTPEPVVLGNVHVGDTAQQALTLSNTAAGDGYSEALNAVFGTTTGDATAAGSINQLGAGGTDTSSLLVGIDTSTAGAKSGTAALDLESDGTGINTLGQTALAGQTVNISGNVYRLAEATIDNPLDFSFGSVHVGDTVEQGVSITNTAVADSYSEGLNASFGGTSDVRITTNGGSFNLLAAGGTDNTSMVVGVDTSAAGTLDGTATLNFASDGTGTSGLGITALPPQDLTVTASISATAYNYADPVINTSQPVAFGNVRVGDVVAAQALSITNDAPDDGFSESLNASADGTTGGVIAAGSFSLLAAQATNTTSITVNIDTTTAGDKSGVATIDFESDGTGTSGLGITALPSQGVNVTGGVFRLAEASDFSSPVVINARVGDVAEQTLSVSNTAVADGYSESLNASLGSATGDATASGSFNLLAAGATDTSSLVVGINTGTAGAKSGTASIGLESDGTGTSGLGQMGIGSPSIDVSGKVYAPAQAAVAPSAIDFGIIHVGDSVPAEAVEVTNIAPVAALNDVLTGSISTGGSAFIGSGNLGSGLAPGATDSSSLTVGLDTSSSGIFTDTATISLFSSNDDMADLALPGESVALDAQVNNYANPIFAFESGDGVFSGSGLSYALDFGTLVQDTGLYDADLAVLNDVEGPADLLDGAFFLPPAPTDYLLSGFDPFTDLDAGEAFSGLSVALDTSILGEFNLTILLNAEGYNASGYRGAFDPISLTLYAQVVEGGASVPEPETIFLLFTGILALATLRRRNTREI